MTQRLIAATAALTVTAMAADLPIREVVLFKHGVGYFERAGQLKPGETAVLQFKAEEMNDVLKSLTVEDKGGKISGLRYDSSEPLDRKLAQYPFQLGNAMSLAAFLDQVKGARVQFKLATEFATGIIVSGRLTASDDKKTEKELVVLLLDSGELRTFDLGAVSAVTFPDPTVQEQLKGYLTATSQARSKEKRSVYIDGTGTQTRDLIASYMTPSPIWKSSYRLIFGDKDSTLEGWAIVDNTSGEDWTNVRLSLVSGRPISFISQLYEPKYRQRPTADLAEEQSAAPVVSEGAVAPEVVAAAPAPMAMGGLARAKKAAGPSGQMMDRAESRSEMASSIGAPAQGRELGELFEYSFSTPVTVKKSESAMLPFLQQKLNTRKLLIYRDGSGQNPLNAAEVSNSSGKTLDGGPITVYDGGAYAGEALMETLKTGDKRLISYAIDLGTRVTTAFDSSRDVVREFHYRRGILTTRSVLQEVRTYTARNVDQKAKTLIIEHAQRPEYKLIGDAKPAETTASAYRFEVKLDPGATAKYAVTEERVYDSSYQITSLTPDILSSYVQNKAMTDAGKRALQQILDKKSQIADVDRQTQQADTEVNEVTRDQDRARQNMISLNQVSGQQSQVQTYATQLAKFETRLAALRDKQGELRKKKSALESELNSLIEKMEF